MADYSAEPSIGARIKAARRARGVRSIRELAERLKGTNLTESILENIEAGRKADLPVSDLLNIAHAIGVPPALLLTPLANSDRAVDLPNLSAEIQAMSNAEFDAWLAGDSSGAYRPLLADERTDLLELASFRELQRLKRELDRARAVDTLDAAGTSRVAYLERQTSELTDFLTSAGWII